MDPLYLFELSGEHGTMCAAEARKCIEAEAGPCRPAAEGPGYLVAPLDPGRLDAVAGRISLTHRIGRYLGSFDPDRTSGFDGIAIPEGSFAVKAKRFEGRMRDVDSQRLVRKLGGALSRTNEVDLEDPDWEVRILMSDRLHVFLSERTVDRDAFEARKVSERPFFSPISLHPRYARALINLTGARRGSTVLDPFCGTGGIAIEAAAMGMKALASDFDPEMVDGTRENMGFYGLELSGFGVADVSDVADVFGEVDAVATDPPYGRSTRTGGEGVDSIYARAMESFRRVLKPGGAAGVVLPHPLQSDAMRLEEMEVQRVHGSLSRYYHVFRSVRRGR